MNNRNNNKKITRNKLNLLIKLTNVIYNIKDYLLWKDK